VDDAVRWVFLMVSVIISRNGPPAKGRAGRDEGGKQTGCEMRVKQERTNREGAEQKGKWKRRGEVTRNGGRSRDTRDLHG